MKELISRAEAWLVTCGSCDAGLPMMCACPDGDPRAVILDLIREVERLRAEKADVPAILEDERVEHSKLADAHPHDSISHAFHSGAAYGLEFMRELLEKRWKA